PLPLSTLFPYTSLFRSPDQLHAHEWARRWIDEQWTEWAPRTRTSAVEALTRLLPLLVLPTAAPRPTGLRAHLWVWLRPEVESTEDRKSTRLNSSHVKIS